MIMFYYAYDKQVNVLTSVDLYQVISNHIIVQCNKQIANVVYM